MSLPKELSSLDSRRRPFAAIIAADESAGLGGLVGALKSLLGLVQSPHLNRFLRVHSPWDNAISRHIIEEVVCHVASGFQVLKDSGSLIH